MIRKRPNDRSTNRQQRSSLWQKCTNLRALKQVHASMVVNGFNSNYSAIRELIFCGAMAISGTIDYAHQVFDHVSEPDNFLWNTMIRGSAQSQCPLNAVLLYTRMENRHARPDDFTFPFVLKACTKLSWVKMGMGIHGKVVRFGFESNTFVRNTLIYFHANCGDLRIASALFDDSAKRDVVPWSALTAGYARRGKLDVARRLFDEMPFKDLVSWNVMITGYAKQGEMESARKLFDEVPKRDVVTWNAMIAGYVLCGSNEQALQMFEEMRSLGEKPDEVTMLSLLSACADIGDLDVGQKIHSALLEMGSGDMSIILGNAVIDMYSKCGSIERALEVFRRMRDKDVSSWNSVIGGLAFHGHSEESVNLFKEMRRLKVRPNEITFVGVLVACSHAGKVEEGRGYFNLMRIVYRIEPNIKHYGCMVDLLGRAGILNEAFEFIEKMEIAPNAIVWRTLLGACRVHGNVELGRRANERLLEMRRDESGDFVLLSNIYASRGEWQGVEEVRKLMDDSGVKKEAGCSLVEADNSSLMHFLFDSKPKSR
ncbi:pentatricopeptide repeat-containing protein [Pyrus ussuriensis x Pyrus communis]|uniref:Pentatricopeptide repeat-containing protein n=1 Tax=Pyrus ussuriensis x Pyrus communis TaxID=2448454 RepID=A0A5N5GSV7_9ROSA|nr:pentatricopeptide repeat-containing protein [Pyrus ussuriensis x Pyrus communis]